MIDPIPNRYGKCVVTTEAAEMLGVTPARVCQMAEEGKLHPCRLSPRLTLWSIKELESFHA